MLQSLNLTVQKTDSEILSQLALGLTTRPRLSIAVVGSAVCLFSVAFAFATITPPSLSDFSQLQKSEYLAPALTLLDFPQNHLLYETRIQRGDTLDSLLQRLMIHDASALSFLHTNQQAQLIAKQLDSRKSVVASISSLGSLQSLAFPLASDYDQFLVIERQGDHFIVSEKSFPLEKQIVTKAAEISHSLFGTSDEMEIPEKIALQLTDIFDNDIDFQHGLRKGDRFSVVYEMFTYRGRPVKTGRILAAEFLNNGAIYRVAWFSSSTEGSHGDYYTADGKSIHKDFLRSPLEFSRITSGFTESRLHPILAKWRAHKGVDYGAPIGTQVKSTAEGIIEFVGRKGGYGNTIIVRHKNSYTTLYGHLSAFASGMRQGRRVNQGDVIAYVGATGLASGPHLHYELRINGAYKDPLKVALPNAQPLSATQKSDFEKSTADYFASLNMLQKFNLALSE
ncbi:MAG TPA: M23 family metallopeptidase [Rugosibacter sp.]